MKLLALMITAGVIIGVCPIWAHHSFAAEFDERKPILLQGTVTKWELTNPHSWIHLDVKGSNGAVVSWAIEGGSPNALFRHGFRKSDLPRGTQIVVHGFQAKSGENKAVGTDIRFTDGRRLFLGGSAPGANGPEPTEGDK